MWRSCWRRSQTKTYPPALSLINHEMQIALEQMRLQLAHSLENGPELPSFNNTLSRGLAISMHHAGIQDRTLECPYSKSIGVRICGFPFRMMILFDEFMDTVSKGVGGIR